MPNRNGTQRVPRTDSGRHPEPLLPLAAAADRLGIAYDTARKRVGAGTLAGVRRGGRWYVRLPEPERFPDAKPDDSGPIPDRPGTAPGGHPDARDRLIAALEGEVGYLRDQLDHSRRELAAERERFDVLHREALARITPEGSPALDAGARDAPSNSPKNREKSEAPDPGSATSDGTAPQEPLRRVWWRVWGRR